MAEEIRPLVAAEIVQETVRECERLLLDAEATAEQMRAAAEADAVRVRRDALRSNARLLTDLEQRRPEVEASLAAARSVADRAVEMSAGLAADAQRRADDLLETAVAHAREVTEQAEDRLAAAAAEHEAAQATTLQANQRFTAATDRFAEADGRHAAAVERAEEAGLLMASATARMDEADGLLAVATQVLAAAEASRLVVDARSRAVEAQSAEVERRFAALAASTEAALADLSAASAEVDARRVDAEAAARRVGERAWHAAQLLQAELLEEADAEALEITWAACVDAAQIRQEAEDAARAVHLEARARADDSARAARVAPAASIAPEVIARERRLASRPDVRAEPLASGGPLAVPLVVVPVFEALVEPILGPAAEVEAAPETEAEVLPPGHAHRRQILATLLLVTVAALLVRLVVATPYSVESESMEPTLVDGQQVVVNKMAYRLGDPARGDVVVLDLAGEAFIKRIVGLPGEVIEARGGVVVVDGQAIDEPYLEAGVVTSTFAAVELGPEQLFVLGDNREASADSRGFGPVLVSEVVGRTDLVLWPLSDAGRL